MKEKHYSKRAFANRETRMRTARANADARSAEFARENARAELARLFDAFERSARAAEMPDADARERARECVALVRNGFGRAELDADGFAVLRVRMPDASAYAEYARSAPERARIARENARINAELDALEWLRVRADNPRARRRIELLKVAVLNGFAGSVFERTPENKKR